MTRRLKGSEPLSGESSTASHVRPIVHDCTRNS
jgi:hypothetical protein